MIFYATLDLNVDCNIEKFYRRKERVKAKLHLNVKDSYSIDLKPKTCPNYNYRWNKVYLTYAGFTANNLSGEVLYRWTANQNVFNVLWGYKYFQDYNMEQTIFYKMHQRHSRNFFVYSTFSWNEANALCRSKSMDMPTPYTLEENLHLADYLAELVPRPFLIFLGFQRQVKAT